MEYLVTNNSKINKTENPFSLQDDEYKSLDKQNPHTLFLRSSEEAK